MKDCLHCKKPIVRPKPTIDEFKKKFKVGDTIYGFATGKKVVITAIGQKRFLYIYLDRDREGVGTMDDYTANWRKKL